MLARMFLVSGMLALLALACPTLVGIWRNFIRSRKAVKLPPLQPGQEFDGWSEYQVYENVASLQLALVILSSVLLFGLTVIVAFSTRGMKPEDVLKDLHYFEQHCPLPPLPPYQGAS